MNMELIYIGDKFYQKSRTIMSSIYEISENDYRRSDFGFIRLALARGEEVHIRQATEQELELAEKELKRIWEINLNANDDTSRV